MRIEVAIAGSQSAKQRGDLLEALAEDLLRIQGYSVESEVRRTGSELDLLCKNKINGRTIYVECKAQREPLSANILKNLLGTVTLSDYSEGWLIAASPLGKEAKGIQFEWEKKPQETRERLSIYTPERVIDALIDANLIAHPPENIELPKFDHGISVGKWILLVTEHGRFWAQPVLMSGVPAAVQVFSAEQSVLVSDTLLLRRLAETDSTLSTLDFEFRSSRGRTESNRGDEDQHPVVQVEHGQSWSDYRPSRPEDFVGRKPAQDSLLKFLDAVRTETTTTRVFAITGDSGMGKSSLIAKLRNRTRNIRYRKKFSMYAVDVRAAVKPSYVLWSLLACLRDTIESGFIELEASGLEISDHADPLASRSIQRVLNVLQQQRRIVCLVFDQFEELYSKPEMFSIYEAAQQLFLSAASAQSNLVLGFAWRADSTVPQDHPAYHMWHGLRDHRFEVSIGPFGHSEASEAITIFQRELGEKLLPGIRRQITENSQGYPWLLKKLCIHLYGQLSAGESQAKLVDTLDVERLFAEDLKALSQPEDYCLKLIAAQAPADWHEMLEAAGADTLRNLQDKRLIVRSGNRINLYWDLFREYVLTGQAPSVPFTYVASSSVRAVLAVAQELRHEDGKSFEELSEAVGRKASTVQNIVHDLVMFRVVQVSGSKAILDPEIASSEGYAILERIRNILKRHALYLVLSAADSDSNVFRLEDVIECLQRTNPTARHGSATWKAYAERIWVWLFCIDDSPPILRAFLRGRVPSGAVFGETAPSHPRPHACSGDLPRREAAAHGGLSPRPAPSGHSRGVLIACRGKEDEAASGRGDDAGLETQVRRAGGAARGRPHRVARFGIGRGGRRDRRHFRRREGFSAVARSRADEPGRPRAGAGPAAPGVGRQPTASVPGSAQPRASRRSGRHRCRERRAARARRRGIDLWRGAGRAPGRPGVRHWSPDAGRYRVAGAAAQAVMTVVDRIDGKGGSGDGACIRSRVAPESACRRTMRFGRRNPERCSCSDRTCVRRRGRFRSILGCGMRSNGCGHVERCLPPPALLPPPSRRRMRRPMRPSPRPGPSPVRVKRGR